MKLTWVAVPRVKDLLSIAVGVNVEVAASVFNHLILTAIIARQLVDNLEGSHWSATSQYGPVGIAQGAYRDCFPFVDEAVVVLVDLRMQLFQRCKLVQP